MIGGVTGPWFGERVRGTGGTGETAADTSATGVGTGLGRQVDTWRGAAS